MGRGEVGRGARKEEIFYPTLRWDPEVLYANQEVRKQYCQTLFYSDVQEEALEAQVVSNGGSDGERGAGVERVMRF